MYIYNKQKDLAGYWGCFCFPVLPCLNLNPLEAFELALGTASLGPVSKDEEFDVDV